MRLALTALAFVLSAAHAHAGETTRYLEVVNRANDSVVALAVARAQDDVFRAIPLGTALRGGGDSTTIEIADANCRQDLRLTFRTGRTIVYRGLDVCRHGRLHIVNLPRTAADAQLADNRRP